MSSWEHFPFAEIRPSGVRIFDESERDELELVIARQIAELLANFGAVELVEVDNSACVDIEDPKTYQALELEPFLLKDDGELTIAQIPFYKGMYGVEKGLHRIDTQNDDGAPRLMLACWDPAISDPDPRRILDVNRSDRAVCLDVLQELYEALIVCTDALQTSDKNTAPYETSEYPVPVMEADFQSIIQRL